LAVVRDAVPSLKQSGSRWKGNCPFHNERTPSFYFQPDKGLWHCFGACQEGGDIIKFVMKLEGISFPEALRELARRTGVALDWDKTDDASSRRAKERDQMLSLLEEASGVLPGFSAGGRGSRTGSAAFGSAGNSARNGGSVSVGVFTPARRIFGFGAQERRGH
jgi:DNA primase